MPRIHFNARRLRSLRPGHYTDASRSGLALRVRETGEKCWTVRYWFAGRQRRDEIGIYSTVPDVGVDIEDARAEAIRIRAEAREGRDPRKPTPTGFTMRDLAELYLRDHAKVHKKPSSAAEDERMLNADVLPDVGDLLVSDFDREQASDLIAGIAARGARVYSNRVRSLLSKMLAFAVARGKVPSNPVVGLPRLGKETARERTLTEDEIRSLWLFWEASATPASIGCQLALLTAARNEELCSWQHTQIEGRWWTIPAEQSKNGIPISRFLSQPAMERVAKLEHKEGPWVLPSPVRGGQRMAQLRKSRKLVYPVDDWTPHDLRRTAATLLAKLGTPPHVIELCLGHALQGVGWTYNRWGYAPEIESAYTKLGDHLLRIVTGKPGELLRFSR